MAKSRSLNKVILIGNLTRNPVLRETNNGVLVCSFGLATNNSWKDKNGEYKEQAQYHNLIAFNKLAEICAQLLAVGMLVYAEGELRNKVIEGDDGRKHYRTEIKLNDMFVMDSKGKKGIGIDGAKDPVDAPVKESSEQETESFDSEDDLKSDDLF